jgi:hypothetical protein
MSKRKPKAARAPASLPSQAVIEREASDRDLSAAVELARQTAMEARNDARNLFHLVCRTIDIRIDRQSVVDALSVLLPAFRTSFTEALNAIDELKRHFGVDRQVSDTEELLERPRAVARVLADAGLLDADAGEDRIAGQLGLLEERLHGAHTESLTASRMERLQLPSVESPRLTVEQKAIGVLTKHPTWTLKQIAKAIGTNVKYLSSSAVPTFRMARAATRAKGLVPLGRKLRDGTIEAVDHMDEE